MKKKTNITLILVSIIIFIVSILYNYYYFKNKETFKDFFTCTLELDNIDPKFKDEYMQYNNKSVTNGVCKRATLNVIVNTCPVDSNGTPIPPCYQKATLTSSFGNPISFNSTVTPQNISTFFGFG